MFVRLLCVCIAMMLGGCGDTTEYENKDNASDCRQDGCASGVTCAQTEDGAWACLEDEQNAFEMCNPDTGAICFCADGSSGLPCFGDDGGCLCNDTIEPAPEHQCTTNQDCSSGQTCTLEGSTRVCQTAVGCTSAEPSRYCSGSDVYERDGCGNERLITECSDGCRDGGCARLIEYRYVLIEDMSAESRGEHPGSDIDAIGVVKNGVERFATTIEDDTVFHEGSSIDTTQALGAPNSNCEAQNFVSLGGVENMGYIIVGFSDASTDFLFGPGDIINVYELGPTTCPNQPNWTDDPYAVYVSVGNVRDQFTAAGVATAAGTNTFIVP